MPRATTKLFIKIFWTSCIPFTTFMLVFHYLIDSEHWLIIGLISGCVFGLINSILIVAFTFRNSRKLADNEAGGVFIGQHSEEINSIHQPEVALKTVRAALNLFPKSRVILYDTSLLRMSAIVNPGILRTGELIEVKIFISEPDSVIAVSSKPTWLAFLGDKKTNIDNVEMIISYLKGHNVRDDNSG